MMGIIKYSANDAFRRLIENKFSRWCSKQKGENDAAVRLTKNLFLPNITPKFKVVIDDKVFAIGSCFARGVEKALSSRGFVVESMAREFDKFELINENVTGLGFTNKYSTFSILNEIKWALDPASEFPSDSVVSLSDETSVDPNTNPTLKYIGREETISRHKIISKVVERIKTCQVLFMTLGLVELWYDNEAEIYLNMAPTPEMKKLYPDRYTFHVSNYMENKNNLCEIHDLLTKFAHPDLKIIVTVSPVPLMATFTQRDIVLANTYSKSVLRAAAEEWALENDNVDYFPSYEIVMNSLPEITWGEDRRHVQGYIVQNIMKLFADNYLSGKNKSKLPFKIKEKVKEKIKYFVSKKKTDVESRSERNIIIHNHLFKNAGSSIDWALNRSFGKRFLDHRDDFNMRQGDKYLGPYLREHPSLKALSTHHLTRPLPGFPELNIHEILMFRHPIERVLSVYNFEKGQKSSTTLGAVHARKYDLSEYVKWRMQPDIPLTIRNFHLSQLLPKRDFQRLPLTNEDLQLAKETVENMPLLGMVSAFDASMILFECFLKPLFPEVDFAYKIQNAGKDKKVEQERIEMIKSEIGDGLFQQLLDHNELDMELYEYANKVFYERVEAMENLEDKLSDFKNRCSRL